MSKSLRPLVASIEDSGLISITLGVEVLAYVAEIFVLPKGSKITDPIGWASDFLDALAQDDGNGHTILEACLNTAILTAYENGSEYVSNETT